MRKLTEWLKLVNNKYLFVFTTVIIPIVIIAFSGVVNDFNYIIAEIMVWIAIVWFFAMTSIFLICKGLS